MKLWRHQRELINFEGHNGTKFLWAGMSTGKTIVAIEMALCAGVTLIITPLSATGVYPEDINTHYMYHPINLIMLNKGSLKSRVSKLEQGLVLSSPTNHTLIVINYDMARKINWHRYNIDLAIADECHLLGKYNGKTSINLAKTCSLIPRKVAMTGTPVSDNYVKLYGIFRWLEPITYNNKRKYPRSRLFGEYDTFLDSYFKTYELTRGVRIINGYKNIDKLQQVIKRYTKVVRTEDVLDLPPIVSRTYRTELTKDAKKYYRDMVKSGIVEYDEDIILTANGLVSSLRAHQICTSGTLELSDGTYTRLSGLDNRINTFKEIVGQLYAMPFVVFTTFKNDVTLLGETLDGLGVTWTTLTGDDDNHEAWKDGEYQCLIVNMSAGATGTRLHRASHAIYWSMSFKGVDFQQSVYRLRRMGQTANTVNLHYIVSKDTIDEKIVTVLARKERDVIKLESGLMDS